MFRSAFTHLFFNRRVDVGETLLADGEKRLHHSPESQEVVLHAGEMDAILKVSGMLNALTGINTTLRALQETFSFSFTTRLM